MKFPKKLDTPEFIKAKIILRWAERSRYAIEIMQQQNEGPGTVDAGLVDDFKKAVGKYRYTLEEFDFGHDKEYNKEAQIWEAFVHTLEKAKTKSIYEQPTKQTYDEENIEL